MNKTIMRWPGLAVLVLITSITASAQTSEVVPVSASATSTEGTNQTVLGSLAILPEADTIIFINSQRIINEALPRLLPEKDLMDMRKTMADIKQFSGVDPGRVDYVVIAVRFRKPASDLSFMPPEFLAVSSGDFSADSLMTMARVAAGGRLREEQYGTKTLGLITIDPIAKEAEKNPMLKSFAEIGLVPLNATTLAMGTSSYLKAAVDAADGQGHGRIGSESLNSLLRDPNALVSIAGSPLTSFMKSFGLLGTEANPREPRCDSKFGDFYAALTMDAANFMLRGALHADNPDTAKILNGLMGALIREATSAVPHKTAQSAMQHVSINAVENEVVLRADFPQQMVLDFIKEQMKPKAESPASSSKPTKKPVRRRRPRK